MGRCAWPAMIPRAPWAATRLIRWWDGPSARTPWRRTRWRAVQPGDLRDGCGNACISCHAPHNAQGPMRLLRGPNEQDCIACHNGRSNLSPAAAQRVRRIRQGGHPFPSGNNAHDAAEDALLNNNRHATCAGLPQRAWLPAGDRLSTSPPAIRVSQTDVAGIRRRRHQGRESIRQSIRELSALSRLQFGQSCQPRLWILCRLRAGGRSFERNSTVRTTAQVQPSGDARPQQPFAQPSLLPSMLDLNGGTTHGRPMGSRSSAPIATIATTIASLAAPVPRAHGSKCWHILERDYEFSQAPGRRPRSPICIPSPT